MEEIKLKLCPILGYQIDKAELIKALNYDRDQYEKGYQDGRSAGYRQAEKEKRKGCWFDVGSLSCQCSECGCKNNKESNYCPECGAYMKGKSCKNCKWHDDFSCVCSNGYSDECADFTDNNFYCEYWETK